MTKRSQFIRIKNNPNQTRDNPNQSDSLSRRASSTGLGSLPFLLPFLAAAFLAPAFFDCFLGGGSSSSSSSSDSSSLSGPTLRFFLLFSSSTDSSSLSRSRLPLRFFLLFAFLLARFFARFAFF
jgi:hypothetical protein